MPSVRWPTGCGEPRFFIRGCRPVVAAQRAKPALQQGYEVISVSCGRLRFRPTVIIVGLMQHFEEVTAPPVHPATS